MTARAWTMEGMLKPAAAWIGKKTCAVWCHRETMRFQHERSAARAKTVSPAHRKTRAARLRGKAVRRARSPSRPCTGAALSSASPKETLARVESHVSRIAGAERTNHTVPPIRATKSEVGICARCPGAPTKRIAFPLAFKSVMIEPPASSGVTHSPPRIAHVVLVLVSASLWSKGSREGSQDPPISVCSTALAGRHRRPRLLA
mmetsp:Transcript_18611/g.60670  ORF Transcript_18611/g.60670 Transcript_18611/m.60670 type:complete len:203 (-) Transcript_18611:262-870(-)